jgi:uncharacterized protein (DUF697 family)
LPIVDQVALVALEIKMIHDLAGHYDVPFKANVVTAILSSLLSGLTGGLLARGLSSVAKAVPVLGTLGGGGGIAVSSASVTFALGSVFIQHFEANGTLLNVDVEWLKTMMNKALKSFKDAGDYEPAIRKWEARPGATQTWDNLKILMCTEYSKAHRQDTMSARATGHASAHNLIEEYAATTEDPF